MKFSEFKKLSYEKKNWSVVENEFPPCPECGGKVEIKDDWELGHWGWGDEDPTKFYVDDLSDWDEEGAQYYICKKCGNIIQTEKSEARSWETDEGAEVYQKKRRIEFDVLDNRTWIYEREGTEKIDELREYFNKGCVKPSIMWGCKLCRDQCGVSKIAIYLVDMGKTEKDFCMKHGFLTEDETFRRKRSRTCFEREFFANRYSAKEKKEKTSVILNAFGIGGSKDRQNLTEVRVGKP